MSAGETRVCPRCGRSRLARPTAGICMDCRGIVDRVADPTWQHAAHGRWVRRGLIQVFIPEPAPDLTDREPLMVMLARWLDDTRPRFDLLGVTCDDCGCLLVDEDEPCPGCAAAARSVDLEEAS